MNISYAFNNEAQRVRVRIDAMVGAKLVKENEPLGKSEGFSEYTQN